MSDQATQSAGDSTGFVPRHGGGRLIPWQKGHSGNPGGMINSKHEYNEAKRICAAHTVEAIQKQLELMRSDDPRVAFIATEAILNRGIGKPKENDESPVRLDLAALSDDDRATLALLLRKLFGGG